ncbi:MAG: hypothetical protein Q8L64_04655 [bacterium]|nr:hypothetical protein [bacterium]
MPQNQNVRNLAQNIVDGVLDYDRRTDRTRSVLESFEGCLKHFIARAESDPKLPTLCKRTGTEPVELLKNLCTKTEAAERFVDIVESRVSDEVIIEKVVALVRINFGPVVEALQKKKSPVCKEIYKELSAFLEMPPQAIEQANAA